MAQTRDSIAPRPMPSSISFKAIVHSSCISCSESVLVPSAQAGQPAVDSVKCQLAVADVAVVLRALLICEETEGETFDIGEKVYFVTDEVVVYVRKGAAGSVPMILSSASVLEAPLRMSLIQKALGYQPWAFVLPACRW